MNKQIPIVFAIVVLMTVAIFTGILLWFAGNYPMTNSGADLINGNNKTQCTMEAKLCPDGSAVGRSGPNCEFLPCPGGDVVGNDRDEHGCIPSAGYQWCEKKQKCLRSWEESCTTTSNQTDNQKDTNSQNSKSAIALIIKDQDNKPLKGITCAVKADEGASKMIPEISQESNAKGECSFGNLNPAFPYLVRVYWTKDKSRVSDVSLSWIPAGTIATRAIIKP